MAEALAKDTDLTNGQWTVASLRDFFLSLLSASDKRHDEADKCLREMIAETDVRYQQRWVSSERALEIAVGNITGILHERDGKNEQRFMATQKALDVAVFTAGELFTAREKAAYGELAALRAQQVAHEEVFTQTVEDVKVASAQRMTIVDKISADNARRWEETAADINTRFMSADLINAKETALMAAIQATGAGWHEAVVHLRETLTAAMLSQKEAVTKAEESSDRKFESVNEFRGTLADQQRMLMPRNEVDVLMRGMYEKIDAQNTTIKEQNERVIALTATVSGKKEGQSNSWGFVSGIIGIVMVLMALFSFFVNRIASIPTH